MATRDQMKNGNGIIPRKRLEDLWSACSTLGDYRRELIGNLRIQLGHLRRHHQQLEQEVARRTSTPFSAPAPLADRFGLTSRELEVTRLLAAGRSNAAIATALNISPHTARHHTQHVLAKLGCHARAEVAALVR